MPREAADLHRPAIEDALRQPNSKRYPWIAEELSRMRELYAKAGADADFAEYLRGIRERFRRRPALMAALDRKRLR
jgi:uncharacterized Zn finger protein